MAAVLHDGFRCSLFGKSSGHDSQVFFLPITVDIFCIVILYFFGSLSMMDGCGAITELCPVPTVFCLYGATSRRRICEFICFVFH